MLKALELFGFKSFAEKTRFEFPAGITVVVGPNGSGKSNIVDGIKWVLGEQSAKSLRGKEMSDVIFKGSGAGRKPMNAAEATVVFDNSEGRLPFDAAEVQVTRRVYRSGEAEYLVNRQPVRLKDIKDLFRGSGVGVDAYSIIEQGKVEKLLQASAKDRRAIFEEAAGISRFKAKKIEAQRRLERVDQNLLRLSDIVEEVENRLKSVRNQAGKAKRYREYSDRLQQLRTQVALTDWRKLAAKIDALETELAEVVEQIAGASAQAESREAAALELDTALITCTEEIRTREAQAARNREQITERETTAQQQRARCRELEEEAVLHRQNLAAMCDRAGDLKQRLRETLRELAAADEVHSNHQRGRTDAETRAAALAAQWEATRRAGETARQSYVQRMQEAAVLRNQIDGMQKQIAVAEQTSHGQRDQLAELVAGRRALESDLAALRQTDAEITAAIVAKRSDVDAAQAELTRTRGQQAARQEDLAQLQSRRRGLAERSNLLAELEQSLEGLGTGVKAVLARAKAEPRGPLAGVRGVLADLLTVHVDHAAAIDAALGDAAQFVVVAGGIADARQITHHIGELPGRVTFAGANLYSLPPLAFRPAEADAAIIGRADELVFCNPEDRPLAQSVLGHTWLVQTLDDAIRLRQSLPAQDRARFVTSAGEVVEASGAISVGPRQSATSLISRRSELRALRENLIAIDEQIAHAQRETVRLKSQVESQEQAVRGLIETARQFDQQAADQRLQIRTLEERLQQSQQRERSVQATLVELDARAAAAGRGLEESRRQLAAVQMETARMQQAIAQEEQQLAGLDAGRQAAARAATAAQIELAKSEQRLEGLHARRSQFEDDQRERGRTLEKVRDQLRQCLERREWAEREILAATSSLASLYLVKEQVAAEIALHGQQRASATTGRAEISEQAAALRKLIRKAEERQHQTELAAGQLRHERNTLVDRLRDDYQIDLPALIATEQSSPSEQQERTEVEAEIESLRRKINQIGAVNLDALDELDELESRFALLSSQHKDLSDAKQALERIIHKINADSRRLFMETLEAIRVNFQALYRKAFGGGTADIQLEEGVDVLEAGVEIIATPPGKPSFNNSLLSGGEKALTAVALLLAIFQFRPSPFCILDEVDAPFDEANIGRFVDVLKEFLGWTKFVIVTHSKKTMTAATTLYGVTMQESGVSKRVSVRFDDVTDDGQIRSEALDRPAPDGAENDRRGVA